MAGAEIIVYPGNEVEYVLDGEDISRWVSEAEVSEEGETLDFQGSGGASVARIPGPTTNGFTMTVANHPTPATLLRRLHRTRPKPTATLVITEFEGASQSMTVQCSSLTSNYDAGEVLTLDAEFTVVGELTA